MTGTTLSHYKIVSELGRGGMGIVYLAEDTKLDRQVAIKVLPPSALASEDDRARFYREAKAAAALNHPNIAQVYQIDEAVPEGGSDEEPRPFIAMEYIDGETLDARIKKGPLKLKEAVRLATQIAGALGEAHDKGIVHRDVKASNVMLTSKGDAKVLDFGLALTAASTKLTRMGSTLGTVAYMSPEQARGEEVDRRTDLWALGVVLYEMIAGRNPFGGDYEQAVVYSILNADPEPLTAVRTGVPMQLEWTVGKLLSKEADLRYQSAADLLADLKALDLSGSGQSRRSMSAMAGGSGSVSGSVSGGVSGGGPDSGTLSGTALAAPGRVPMWGAVAIGVAAFALAWAISVWTRPPEPVPPTALVEISLPGMSNVRFPRLSPSGDYLAFRGVDSDNRVGLFLRDMASGEIRHFEETETAGRWEFDFSPDGGRIAFTDHLNGGVFTVAVPNGIPERRSDFGRFSFWEDNSTIVFSDDKPGGGDIYRLDLETGDSTTVPIDNHELEEGYGNVVKTFDPESRIAYGHQLRRPDLGEFRLFSLDMETGAYRVLESNAANPEYLKGGLLLYQVGGDDGKLVVRPVDRSTGIFVGRPEDALLDQAGIIWSQYAVTAGGGLMTLPDEGRSTEELVPGLWQVALDEKEVRRLPLTLPESRIPSELDVSPDGRYVVFAVVVGSGNEHVFGFDLQDQVQYQYTFEGIKHYPHFNPATAQIYYSHWDSLGRRSVRSRFDGSSITSSVTVFEDGSVVAVSPDGRWLALRRTGEHDALRLWDIENDRIVWEETGDDYGVYASFSADSRYVAFALRPADGDEQDLAVIVRSTSTAERQIIPDLSTAEVMFGPMGDGLYFEDGGTILRLPARTNPAFSVTGSSEAVVSGIGIGSWALGPREETLFAVAREISFGEGTSREISTRIVWRQHWAANVRKQMTP